MSQAKWTEEMVLEGIRRRHRDGRPINFSAVVTDDEPLSGAARRFFGSWGSAISAAGLDYEAIKKEARKGKLPSGSWSKESIVQAIQDRQAAGKALNPHSVQKDDQKLYSAAFHAFGSWGKAVEAAGQDYLEHRQTRDWTEDKIIERIKAAYSAGADLSDNTVNVLAPGLYGAAQAAFGSWQGAIIATGLDYEDVSRTTRWNKAKIVTVLHGAAGGGRPLVENSFPESLRYAVMRHFGSWEDALKEAGFADRSWSEVDKAIKNNIREFRKAAGLSEVKLGELLGVSHRTISMLELSQYIDPRVSFAIRIARTLGCRVEDLFHVPGDWEQKT